MDSTDVDFWEHRYRANRTPWDQHGVPPALQAFLQRTPARGRVLLPGCGSGYEVRAFHEAGWQPLAIDYSPAALEHARAHLGPLSSTLRLADFFADDLGGPFDWIYERTFLCSMPPAHWPHYVRRMAELLRPGGNLFGIFAHGHEPEPPPYLLGPGEAETLLGPVFRLTDDRPIPAAESLPIFADKERWQIWTR